MSNQLRWKPWETVPRDGSRIIALDESGYVTACFLDGEIWRGLDETPEFEEDDEGRKIAWIDFPEAGADWLRDIMLASDGLRSAKEAVRLALKYQNKGGEQ